MILVIGAGVAGICCAIEAASARAEVTLVTPGVLGLGAGAAAGAAAAGAGAAGAGAAGAGAGDAAGAAAAAGFALAGGNTALAQGGIAAAIGAGDSPVLHAADTIAAGAGLVDAAAADQLTAEGAAAVRTLIDRGFQVDRDASGAVAFGLEAAHGRPRIVHAGEDRSGAALHAFLRSRLAAMVAEGRIRLVEETSAVSLLSEGGAVTGAVLRRASGRLSAMRADAVVLATGGYAALYPQTSNHVGARGEGIVLAARIGAAVADLEFVQFHPTVLAGTGFLISEAVRGAGAVLRDERGERFMVEVHEAAELAPRDVVSRAVHRSMRASGAGQVWLDATGIEREGGSGTLERRFPAITRAVRAQGFDWSREAVPVAPAAHYTMGGVVTDLDGRTSLPGLFAAGEVSCTGVHGANRLASNSLLEGLVFGSRAARAAVAYTASSRDAWLLRGAGAVELIGRAEALPARTETLSARTEALSARTEALSARTETLSARAEALSARAEAVPVAATTATEIAAAVAAGLGIERDVEGLQAVARLAASCSGVPAELAGMIAQAALARTESRGSHQRADYPVADPAAARRRAWLRRSAAAQGEAARGEAARGEAVRGEARIAAATDDDIARSALVC